jgi:predicted dehydrogenase
MARHQSGRTLNRRQFLGRTAAAVAGAVAFPTIIPGRALGLDGATAPSNRLTMGFIGMGKMAKGHLGAYQGDESCQILAICDVEQGRREKAAAATNEIYAKRNGENSYSACDTYGDFRVLCARADIDFVVIATPNHWHVLTALEALRNGKDVYLEKPMTRTIEEGKILTKAVRRYGRILQVGSQQRSDNAFRFACELVRNGRIGEVQEVYANIGGPPEEDNLPGEPTPEGLDWDMWLGPCPWRPYSSVLAPPESFDGWPMWRNYRPYAEGGMDDWGAHHFDIAQWGLGMDGSGPVEILVPSPEHPEVKTLTFVYANGVRLYHGGGKIAGAGTEWAGTKGRVGVNRGEFLVAEPEHLKYDSIGPNEIHLYDSPDHRKNFLECVRTRREPICPVEVGHSSATLCHLGTIGYWLKRPLKWNPEKQEFVNDSEANRLLSRAMRGPWQLA